MLLVAGAVVAALAMGAEPAQAQSDRPGLTGKPVALDATTLYFPEAQARLRLWGISGPRMREWPWGPRARAALDLLIFEHGRMTCEQVGGGQPPAMLCNFEGNGADPAELMLQRGWAVEARAETERAPERLAPRAEAYSAAEDAARAADAGMWGSGCKCDE